LRSSASTSSRRRRRRSAAGRGAAGSSATRPPGGRPSSRWPPARRSSSSRESEMPLRSYRPTSPGLRGMTRSTFEEITTREPHKPLLEPQKRDAGRNNTGRQTVRHRGGGEKQHYRRIDFKRDKAGVPARLATIEYDPNRSAGIGLLHYRAGDTRCMLLPHGLKVGDVVVAGPGADARVGNALPIANIPVGTTIPNIQPVPGKGGQVGRSAGGSGRLSAK